MTKYPRAVFFTIATTLAAIPSASFAADLASLLPQLVEAHPRIRAAKEDMQSAVAAREEAFSGYLPTVDLNASSGLETVDRTNLSPAGSKTDETATSYSASLTQNLFEGFRTQASVRSASLGIEAAKFTLATTEQQTLFEGISAYLEVLRFIELTQLAQDNQDTLREQLHLEDERVRRGSGIAVDALQAKSRLQVSKERYTAFMGALKDAISRYTQVYNVTPEIDTMQLPSMPVHLLPATLEEAVAVALDANPQLHTVKHNLERASVQRKTAQSGFFPSVDLVGSTSYDENVSGILGEEVNHSVKLESTWQIFSGFSDRAKVKQAEHGYQSAMENSEHIQRKIVEEVKLAWSTLTTNKERAELLENAVNIAGEVYDARKRLRDAGSETALNVLDAENELYRARIDAASARYDYFVAIYRLMLATGKLNLETATQQASSSPPVDAVAPAHEG